MAVGPTDATGGLVISGEPARIQLKLDEQTEQTEQSRVDTERVRWTESTEIGRGKEKEKENMTGRKRERKRN